MRSLLSKPANGIKGNRSVECKFPYRAKTKGRFYKLGGRRGGIGWQIRFEGTDDDNGARIEAKGKEQGRWGWQEKEGYRRWEYLKNKTACWEITINEKMGKDISPIRCNIGSY